MMFWVDLNVAFLPGLLLKAPCSERLGAVLWVVGVTSESLGLKLK